MRRACLELLHAAPFRVSPRSDRMGYRLEGPHRCRAPTAAMIIGTDVRSGAMQVPPSGEPILLMADRQTTGGYPKIGDGDRGRPAAGRPAGAGRLRSSSSAARTTRPSRARARAREAQMVRAREAPSTMTQSRPRDGSWRRAFGAERVRARRARSAPLTTFKVGGPADCCSRRDRATRSSRARRWRASAGVPVTLLGGGSNVLIADAGVRGLVLRPRGGDIEPDRRRPRPRRCGGHDQRAGALDDQARAGRPRSVGGHAGHRRRRDLRQRALRRPADRRSRRVACGCVAPTGDVATCRRRRWRSATIAAACSAPARCCCRRRSRCRPGDPAALRAIARAVARVSQAHAAARLAERRLHLPEPGAGRDRVPDGIPRSAGALVDRAGLKGARVGGARVSPTHGNFIVNDGQRDRRRHPRADRALPRGGARALRRRPARRDRLPRRVLSLIGG